MSGGLKTTITEIYALDRFSISRFIPN